MTGENRPLSEIWHEAAIKHADLEFAAQLLEDTKSAVLSQRKRALGEMADSKAETLVKASPEWEDYIRKTVEARYQANLAKVEKELWDKKFSEWQSLKADERIGARM